MSPCGDRTERYRQTVRTGLSERSQRFWDQHLQLLAQGVIHVGKLERYFGIFRRVILPLVHRRRTLHALMEARDQGARELFYQRSWDGRRWRALFRVFFGRTLLGRLGRDPAFFRYVQSHDVGGQILASARAGLIDVPTDDNEFLRYILTGGYRVPDCLPWYLRPDCLARIRPRLDRLQLVEGALESYLPEQPVDRFAAFNLSDIFEYMSADASAQLLAQVARTGCPGARALYWNLLVPRSAPPELAAQLLPEVDLAAALLAQAKTFFYGGLTLERVA